MYTKTVQSMIKSKITTETPHILNKCSQCNNAVWMTTKDATYKNSGSMSDYLKFLTSNAEERNDATGYYRCYCRILHEYHDFSWYDKNEIPHIIDMCDAFEEYTCDVEEENGLVPKQRMTPRTDITTQSAMEV